MEDRTLGIIYALKLGSYDPDTNIRKFMSEWSQSDWDLQGREEIDKLLRYCASDYLMNCNNINEIRRYFNNNSLWIRNEYYRIIAFLQQAQVKDFDGYLNGFKPNPYSHFKIFQR